MCATRTACVAQAARSERERGVGSGISAIPRALSCTLIHSCTTNSAKMMPMWCMLKYFVAHRLSRTYVTNSRSRFLRRNATRASTLQIASDSATHNAIARTPMCRPCRETSPAKAVNMLSAGSTVQNSANCAIGGLPPGSCTAPNVSERGRTHAVNTRPTASNTIQAANRAGLPKSPSRTAGRPVAPRIARTIQTNANAHASAMP